jgi:lantibiotic modifying enzyme
LILRAFKAEFLTEIADSHNFGKKVTPVLTNRGFYFHKPRTLFWENLFFGKDSQLKKILSGLKYPSALSPFFNLESEYFSNYDLLLSKRVESKPILESSEFWRNFGILLGYCYAFGIFDLHKHNVIPNQNSLQVIDVEMVLGQMILPNESLLIEFKDFSHSMSALAHVRNSSRIPLEFFATFIGGFEIAVESIALATRPILHLFKAIGVETEPIRVILRSTKKYQNHLDDQNRLLDLIPEELFQLRNGDIPYFFIYKSRPGLMFFKDSSGTEGNVAALGIHDVIYKRLKVPIDELLDPKTLMNQLLPRGVLFLAKKFCEHPASPVVVLSQLGQIEINSSSVSYLLATGESYLTS